MINKLLKAEGQSWSEELARYRLFIARSELTPEDHKKYDFFIGCILAILKELEELEHMAEEEKKKYRVVKLYTRTFPLPNDEEGIGFFTFWPVFVAGEENKGPQVKGIKILFNRAFVDEKALKYGDTLLVEKEKMHIPLYKIDNGKYPYIWIDSIEDIVHEDEMGTIK